MRPSSRDRIVDAALRAAAAADGADVSLDTVGRMAGVTKQGVMYHFPSKDALRRAMLERVLADWEASMADVLGEPLTAASPARRVRAYASVAARGHVVEGEPALFADLLRRSEAFDRYAEWADGWFLAGVPEPARGRLLAAWLAANGLWSALTARKLDLSAADVAAVLSVVDDLTEPLLAG